MSLIIKNGKKFSEIFVGYPNTKAAIKAALGWVNGKLDASELPAALAVGAIEQAASQSNDKAPSSVALINMQRDKILYNKGAATFVSTQFRYVNNAGAVVVSGMSTDYVDTITIPSNTKLITCKGRVHATVGYFAFYNDVTLISFGLIQNADVVVEVPATANIMYISRYYNIVQVVNYYVNKDVQIDVNKTDLSNLKNIIDEGEIQSGTILSTGVISIGIYNEDRIRKFLITDTSLIYIITSYAKTSGVTQKYNYAFYSSIDLNSNTFISGGTLSSGAITTTDLEVAVPANAKYLVVAYNTDYTVPNVRIKNKTGGLSRELAKEKKYLKDILIMTDSLGAMGSGFANYLTEPSYYNIMRYGVGGERTLEIMGRMGVCPFKLTNDVVIPATTDPVGLTLKTSWDNSNITNLGSLVYGLNPCYIYGIKGTLTWDNINQNGTFTRLVAGTETTAKSGTPIISNALTILNNCILICWMGQNGGFSADFNILLDQFRLVARGCKSGKFLLISSHLNTSDSFELAMTKEFGERYINMRFWAVKYGLTECNIVPTQADLDAIAAGNCPPSLLSDGTHFIEAAKIAQAALLKRRLIELDYLIS